MNDCMVRFRYLHPQMRSCVLREGGDLPKDTQYVTESGFEPDIFVPIPCKRPLLIPLGFGSPAWKVEPGGI